jgi:hypothetical protein
VITGFLSYFEGGKKTKSRMRTVYRKPPKSAATTQTTAAGSARPKSRKKLMLFWTRSVKVDTTA